MTTAAIIQCRLGSTRLPNKTILPLGTKTALEYCILRTQQALTVDKVIVSTPNEQTLSHKPLIDICHKMGVKYFCDYVHEPEDVLSRVISTASFYEIDTIVEITADCPLIDNNIIDEVVAVYKCFAYDYVTNAMFRCYPDGMDVQAYSLKLLKEVAEDVTDLKHRSHVGWNIHNSLKEFTRYDVVSDVDSFWPQLRLTLDTEEDYKLIDRILRRFSYIDYGPTLPQILNYLRENPKLLEINSNVVGKVAGEG